MIDLSFDIRNSSGDAPMRQESESPLIDFTFRTIRDSRFEVSPIVVVSNEQLEPSRWIDFALQSAPKVTDNPQVLWFRDRDWNRMVNHAHNTNSLSDLRDRFDNATHLVFEFPNEFAEGTQVFHEWLHRLDRSVRHPQMVIVILSQCPRANPRIPAPISSRLASGMRVDLAQVPERLKRHDLQQRLGLWLEAASSEEQQRLLSQPMTTWQAWDDTIVDLQNRLNGGKPWPRSLPGSAANADTDPESLTPKKIGLQVAKVAQVKWSELKSSSRRKSLVRARSVAIYLMRRLTGSSFESLGRILGNRDHSTVIHAYRKIEQSRDVDSDLEQMLLQTCQQLRVSVPNPCPNESWKAAQ